MSAPRNDVKAARGTVSLPDATVEAGLPVELLQALHLLTREGKLNQDARRKLKQVRHLVGFIAPLIEPIPRDRPFVMADLGAGKSYLGFILYHVCLRDRPSEVHAIEARAELIDASRQLARRLGHDGMRFHATDVASAGTMPAIPKHVDVVVALHACDTATDDAIEFALRKEASSIVLAPCCQAEVAGLLRGSKALALARTPLAELWRRPLHTREFGSQVTNVLRCLYLEANGYSVDVTELVGWEHSLKNELIIARRDGRHRTASARRMQSILSELGLAEIAPTRYPRIATADAA